MISATVKSDRIAGEDVASCTRKRYWVLPGMQMRIILWGVVVTSLMATVAAWTVLLVVWPPLAGRFVWSGSGPSIDELFRIACMRVFLTTGLLVLLFAVIAFVTGLFVSHKVAGPLYRMGQIARQVARGRLGQRVTLRKQDYVISFVNDFNGMLDQVESRLQRQQAAFDTVETQLDKIEKFAAGQEPSSDKVEACFRETRNVLRDVRNEALSNAAG